MTTSPRDRTGPVQVPEELFSTAADEPGPLRLHVRLGDVRVRLALREFAAAMELLDELEPETGNDAFWYAARGWALAGTERFDEAREMLTRAQLHASRSRWVMKQVLLDAQKGVAALKREHAERTKQHRRRTQARPTRARPPAKQAAHPSAAPAPVDGPEVPLRFALVRAEPPAEPDTAPADASTALADYRRRAVAVEIDQLRRYDTLLSLAAARGVDHYEYQLRTVRRVLRDFHGRALLADEVGLGKTVEACLCLEEYFQRGLARRALLLVPPGLVEQWRDELAGKFGREARVVTGAEARRDPEVWRQAPLVLTSMALARSQPHAQRIAESGFDMVVVDEAHRLKNERTLLWQLVDRIRARYLLLLSATPVENDLLEIYNVLSLLRPGLFSTQADFKRRFVAAGRRTPKDPVALRALLRQVMIRNTRAVADARLPPRFATTLRATSTDEERAFRTNLDAAIRERLAEGSLSRALVGELLRAAGARPPAAARLVERHLGVVLGEQARELRRSSKDALLADLLRRSEDDKVIVFASHRDSVDHLAEVVTEAGRRPVVFHGSLSAAEKAAKVTAFRDHANVLVATDSGGEGFNLHFARTVVNYDLPWNPMRIEQRIGRVHRIGQERDVFVFNLVADGTIEEEILRVLDEKIDMFELVVGEVEAILGRLGDDEREFSDLVLDIYAETGDATAMRARFDALAETMLDARRRHLETIAFENQVFGRDLEA
ncbi:MAG: DEAD/DEAH box helicase [Planctomycetota bacterium]